ncbi:MAG: P-II family nitrogen regulator [Ignavibacteriaceae bacterium]|nr:P-II family nitrogen regulator [Ignavibacteriaceae bacterium]
MKEIKAYIRPSMAEKVISALELADVPGMTVIDVSTIGKWADPQSSKLSIEYCEKYSTTIKIELVCEENDVNKFVEIILKNAHTGRKGDGKIFIPEISEAVSIRTKKHGAEAI